MIDTRQVHRSLIEIPDLYSLLPLFTGLMSGSGEPSGGGGNPSRPPANLALVDLTDTREKPDAEAQRTDYDLDRMAGGRRQGVLPTLASWTRLVDGELWDEGIEHDDPAADPTVVSECAFLLTHLGWCSEQQWFDELAADVKSIRRDLRDAVRERDEEPLRCFVEGCGWGVDRVQPAGAEFPWYRCSGCGTTWSHLEVYRLHERQKPMRLSACAESLGRPLSTLKEWRQQGWLRPFAREGSTSLYRLVDVQQVALRVQHGRKTELSVAGERMDA